jgi:hypothetical protein
MDSLITEWEIRMDVLATAIATSNREAANAAERLMFDKALLHQNVGREAMQEYRAIRRCRNELIQLKEQDNG